MRKSVPGQSPALRWICVGIPNAICPQGGITLGIPMLFPLRANCVGMFNVIPIQGQITLGIQEDCVGRMRESRHAEVPPRRMHANYISFNSIYIIFLFARPFG